MKPEANSSLILIPQVRMHLKIDVSQLAVSECLNRPFPCFRPFPPVLQALPGPVSAQQISTVGEDRRPSSQEPSLNLSIA
jgi:hypothetical protein